MNKDFKQNNKFEDIKNFWNERPCNIKHSNSTFGSKKYFNEIEERRFFVESHILEFAQFEKWNNKNILEIGCGIGTDTINFARHGANVTSIDLSDKSIEIAKYRAKIFNLENKIKFINGNAECLEDLINNEKKFDLVYSFGVLHHTLNPENILKQIYKFSNSETEIKIMVYNKYSWKALWILFKYAKFRLWNIKDYIQKYSEAQNGCPRTLVFSKKELIKLMEKNNFEIQEIQIKHIFKYKIEDYINYCYVKPLYFRYMPSFLFSYLENKFGWHLCVNMKIKS